MSRKNTKYGTKYGTNYGTNCASKKIEDQKQYVCCPEGFIPTCNVPIKQTNQKININCECVPIFKGSVGDFYMIG